MQGYLHPPVGNLTRLFRILSVFFVTKMWIKKMIESQKNGLRVTGKQDAQKRRGHNTENKKMERTDLSRSPKNEIEGHCTQTNHPVVHPPYRHQEIPGLPIVGIPTLGTSIERGKPVVKRAHTPPRTKQRLLATCGTLQPHRTPKVDPCFVKRARGFSQIHFR